MAISRRALFAAGMVAMFGPVAVAAAECPVEVGEVAGSLEALFCIECAGRTDHVLTDRAEALGYLFGRLSSPGVAMSDEARDCVMAAERELLASVGADHRIAFALGRTRAELGGGYADLALVRGLNFEGWVRALEARIADARGAAGGGSDGAADLSETERAMIGRWQLVRSVQPDGTVAEPRSPYIYVFTEGRRIIFNAAGIEITGNWRIGENGRLEVSRDEGVSSESYAVGFAGDAGEIMVWRGDDGSEATLMRLDGG